MHLCQEKSEQIQKVSLFKQTSLSHLSSSWIQLDCIDLYFYEGIAYFTLIDIYSNFPFCIAVKSKEAIDVKIAYNYDKFCATYSTPENILSDNGG